MPPSSSKSPPQLHAKLEAFSPIAAALSVVTGLLALTGWALHVSALQSVVPGLPAMKANAALAFILAGISLFLSSGEDSHVRHSERSEESALLSKTRARSRCLSPRRPLSMTTLWLRPRGRVAQHLRRCAASACALAVVALGLLTLSEYALGRDFGIDQLLVKDPRGWLGPFPPGRIPPVACLNFVAVGCGLLLLDVESRKGHRPTEFLALMVSLGGTLGLLNITYHPGFSYTGMAPNGILMFFVLSGGLLGARPSGHLVGLLFGKGLGAATARRLLPASILIPLLLGWLRLECEQRGLFGAELGTGIMILVNVATLAAVVLFTARSLDKTDAERRRVQDLIYAAARDIRERKQAEERRTQLLRQAEEAEAKFRGLLEAAPDAILLADSMGRILLVNRKVEEVFGYPREELLGMPEEILMPERLRKAHDENRLGYYAHPKTRAMHGALDLFGRRKDGSEFPAEISLSPMQSEDGLLVIAVVRDITERKRVQEQLEELRRQNELILNSAGDGICRIGFDGRCTFVNLTAARMIGWEVDELLGRDLHDITHHTKSDGSSYLKEECPASQALRDGKSRSLTEVFWRKDGSSFPVEYTCTPIRENDHIAGAVVTFRDITERRSVERMKDEFISLAGHEMRTPLTSIRGALGLVASGRLGELSPQSQRMLEVAVVNTDRLVRLINDILDIERMESGRVSLLKRTCDAAELIGQAAEVMRPMAEKAGVVLSTSPESVWVEADPDSILQTLTNLLSNAIKFSPSGRKVGLTAKRQGLEVLFQVSDQGRGIPADKIESIFERFQQVDASDSREKGGTGLGLCICRSIVERHGGRIWAESQVGVGSTFFFTVPAGQNSPSQASAGPKGERPLILVCDDDPVDREAARDLLERCGYRVVTVASGAEAIEQATVERPSAVVLDLMMPGMGGWETMAVLKEKEITKDIPVIVSSSLSPEESRVRPAQVAAWLRKPLSQELLVEVLRVCHLAATSQVRD